MIQLRRSQWDEGRFFKDTDTQAWVFKNIEGTEMVVMNPKRIPDYPSAFCHVRYSFRPGMSRFIHIKSVQMNISGEATDLGWAV